MNKSIIDAALAHAASLRKQAAEIEEAVYLVSSTTAAPISVPENDPKLTKKQKESLRKRSYWTPERRANMSRLMKARYVLAKQLGAGKQ